MKKLVLERDYEVDGAMKNIELNNTGCSRHNYLKCLTWWLGCTILYSLILIAMMYVIRLQGTETTIWNSVFFVFFIVFLVAEAISLVGVLWLSVRRSKSMGQNPWLLSIPAVMTMVTILLLVDKGLSNMDGQPTLVLPVVLAVVCMITAVLDIWFFRRLVKR